MSYIPDEQSYLLQMLKAENDACYEHTVTDEVLNGLKEEDKEYVRYVCAVNRASLMANINQNESQRIYHEIILHFKKNNSEQCIQDKRILQIVLDSVFFTGNVSFYEEMKKQYEPAFFRICKNLDLKMSCTENLRWHRADMKMLSGSIRILQHFIF